MGLLNRLKDGLPIQSGTHQHARHEFALGMAALGRSLHEKQDQDGEKLKHSCCKL